MNPFDTQQTEQYNFDTDVIQWNKDRGFLDKPFSLEKDTGYLISEVLEALAWDEMKSLMQIAFSMLDTESMSEAKDGYGNIDDDLADVQNHDDFARWMVKYFLREDYDNTDYCDLITDLEVFGVGGRAKIGLNENNINAIRKAVMDKNNAKKPGDVDEHGKQRKGADFTPPEEVIESILESIK
ncbi:MAG: hypothetical protein KAI79_18030 [Bacteroidales bacterium]|nr:hypothetical protein [Bacteroidales bacterium]